MRSYKVLREEIEKTFELAMRVREGKIYDATELVLEIIREAYKNGRANQWEAINATEIAIAIKIRKEISENVRDI